MEAVNTVNLGQKSLTQRVAANFSWSLISEGGCKGLLFVTMIYLARVLGTENFGIFNFANTVITYFWLAVDLGSNMYGAREVSKHKDNPSAVLNALLTIRMTSGLLVFCVFISLTYFLGTPHSQKYVYLGFSFYLIFRAVYTEWFLRGIEKFNYIAIGNLSAFGFFLLSCLLFVKGKEHLARSAFFWSFSFLFGGVTFLYLTAKSHEKIVFKPVFDLKIWRLHLKESIHFTLSGGLSTLYQQMPIFLLGMFSSSQDVGLYSAAHRAIFSLIFLFAVYPMAIYPILSGFHKKSKNDFSKLLRISTLAMVLAAFLCAAVLFIFSKQLIVMLFGYSYIGSLVIFKVLIGFFFLRAVREVYFIALSSAGLQRFYTIASSFGVIVITMLFLGMKYSLNIDPALAAAASLLITEFGIILIVVGISRMKGLTS